MDTGLDEVSEALAAALRDLPQHVPDGTRIDRISQLETMAAAIHAAQARETVAFTDSQREQRRAAGVVADRLDRGLAAQVALARRISPWQATRYVKASRTLVHDLPETLAALTAGDTSIERALTVAREAGSLNRDQRAELDAEIAPQLAGMGDRDTQSEAQRITARLDPEAAAARTAKAERDRNVSLRPAEDAMARLTALIPGVQGAAAYAALQHAAEQAKASGDPRTRAQIMTDTMIERVTGQATAADVPVQLNMIITDQGLFNHGEQADEPALLTAAGIAPLVLPAELARRSLLDRSGKTKLFIRRLYRNPTTNQLAAMDSHARHFPVNQMRFLILRDQHCRTPYCGAPIRHADHLRPAANGGPTAIVNGAGKCEACNHSKQAAGWYETASPDGTMTTRTPTGHHYTSRPPRTPGSRRPGHRYNLNLDLRWLHAV